MKSKYIPREPSADVHPMDVYTPEMHEVNLDLARGYMAALGQEFDDGKLATPWMMTDHGLARMQSEGDHFNGDFVETRQRGYYGLAAHFVKHTVELDLDGIDGKTKVYPPLHQTIGIICMNQPISAGMMMGYPTIHYSPRGASDVLTAHLNNPGDQQEAARDKLTGLFAYRPTALRRWVRVKL